MNLLFKIIGIILLIAGFVLTIKPNLITTIPESITSYQMIEKRVMWGILIGLGIFGIFHHQIDSWKPGVFALLSAVTLGIIIARIVGLLMDGFFIQQLWWLLIEAAALLVFGFFYWKLK